MMILRKAKPNEAIKILKFYQDVIKSIENTSFKPKWNEKYPNIEYIKTSIEKEELYICTERDEIVSSFILNNEFDNDYSDITWMIDAKPDEILIIHTFAINSNYRSKGLSAKIFDEIKKMNQTMKTLRIDIVDGNIGAEKVFEKLGFEYVTSVEIKHYAVGLQKFHLYEYVLKLKK